MRGTDISYPKRSWCLSRGQRLGTDEALPELRGTEFPWGSISPFPAQSQHWCEEPAERSWASNRVLITNKEAEPHCCIRSLKHGHEAGLCLWVWDTPVLPLGCSGREEATVPHVWRCHLCPRRGAPAPVTRPPSDLPHSRVLGVFLAAVSRSHNSSPPAETNLLLPCLLWRDVAAGSSPSLPRASAAHAAAPPATAALLCV